MEYASGRRWTQPLHGKQVSGRRQQEWRARPTQQSACAPLHAGLAGACAPGSRNQTSWPPCKPPAARCDPTGCWARPNAHTLQQLVCPLSEPPMAGMPSLMFCSRSAINILLPDPLAIPAARRQPAAEPSGAARLRAVSGRAAERAVERSGVGGRGVSPSTMLLCKPCPSWL